MIYRVTVANVAPRDLAELGQAAGLNGTVYASEGFGNWGIEPGATVEFAGVAESDVEGFTRAALKFKGESAAYVTVDGNRAFLLYEDGAREYLSGS